MPIKKKDVPERGQPKGEPGGRFLAKALGRGKMEPDTAGFGQAGLLDELQAVMAPRSIGEARLHSIVDAMGARRDAIVEEIAIRKGLMDAEGQVPPAAYVGIFQELVANGYLEQERAVFGMDLLSAEEALNELQAPRYSESLSREFGEQAEKVAADFLAKELIRRYIGADGSAAGPASGEEELLKAVSDIRVPHSSSFGLADDARNQLEALIRVCPLESVKNAAKEKISLLPSGYETKKSGLPDDGRTPE